MPYFPPHVGGVEKVGQEIWKYWTKEKLGSVTHIIFDVWQIQQSDYNDSGCRVVLLPSFDLVSNFPFPKFWRPSFWKVLKNIPIDENTRVITHTRFFLSSFIWGLFAQIHRLEWTHIEHGSGYVKLSSDLKSKLAYGYDRIVWKYIFKKATRVVAISQACKNFVEQEFAIKDVQVWNRGVDFPEIQSQNSLKEKFPWKTIIWYIGRLYKWKNLDALCQAYRESDLDNSQLVIVGWWEELKRLSAEYASENIYFTGEKTFLDSFWLQAEFDIHMHPSSQWWGLATTLLQAMQLGSYIVVTPFEWANEVIQDKINGVLLVDDSSQELMRGLKYAVSQYKTENRFAEYNAVYIKQNFSWKKNILVLSDIIK